jgi:hypothetical protein
MDKESRLSSPKKSAHENPRLSDLDY